MSNPKRSKNSLGRFIIMPQFYAPSIPNLSQKLVSHYSMIRGKKAQRSALNWTADTTKAFVDAKDCLANFTALGFPAPNAKTSSVTTLAMTQQARFCNRKLTVSFNRLIFSIVSKLVFLTTTVLSGKEPLRLT